MKISVVKTSQLYFLLSFAGMILAGTGLLHFCCTALNWIDAGFTATSAVCVTGLETVRIADLGWAGQLVVLLLIQAGGIGIMTLTTSIILMMGHRLSYGGVLIMSNISDRFSRQGTEGLARMVFYYTLLCEGIGFLLLLPLFLLGGGITPVQAVWYALFHAVSAFCNAGLSPLPAGLEGISGAIRFVIAFLFILGGLGVYVVYDIVTSCRNRLQLHAQTRLILAWSAGLLLAGSAALWLLQFNSGRPVSLLDAFFQSAACRTAGFRVLELDKLCAGSMTVMVVLMLIGAAPGSTGGGMKVTTFALAVAGLYSSFKGASGVILYKRTVPPENVLKAFVVLVTYLLLTAFGSILLASLTPCSMHWALFETASALATVGLALDNPEAITAGAKVMLIVFMFLGRVGFFTFFLFLLGRSRRSRLVYPEERIVVN